MWLSALLGHETTSEFNKSVLYEQNRCLNWFVARIKLVLALALAGELHVAGCSAVATTVAVDLPAELGEPSPKRNCHYSKLRCPQK